VTGNRGQHVHNIDPGSALIDMNAFITMELSVRPLVFALSSETLLGERRDVYLYIVLIDALMSTISQMCHPVRLYFGSSLIVKICPGCCLCARKMPST
jgi:hypothetical protein